MRRGVVGLLYLSIGFIVAYAAKFTYVLIHKLYTGGKYLMSLLTSALFVGFFSGIAGGCCIYLLIHWSHARFQLGLDYRLSDLEARVIREVKIRGLDSANKKQNWEKEFLEKVAVEKAEPQLTLKSWKESAYKR